VYDSNPRKGLLLVHRVVSENRHEWIQGRASRRCLPISAYPNVESFPPTALGEVLVQTHLPDVVETTPNFPYSRSTVSLSTTECSSESLVQWETLLRFPSREVLYLSLGYPLDFLAVILCPQTSGRYATSASALRENLGEPPPTPSQTLRGEAYTPWS
jgi:hypothetical protein